MSFPTLKIIGERINPGFRSTREMFERRDIPALVKLASEQVARGASYLNVNVGDLAESEPEFLDALVRAIQDAVRVPLSFDYPSVAVQRRCLGIYRYDVAGGKPFVNSISELRWDMCEVLREHPCRVILMASERNVDGEKIANRTAGEVYDTALRMTRRLLDENPAMTIDDLYIDVSVGPVAADTEGLTRMALESIRQIGASPELKGVHMSVGLTNLSIMLPAKTPDGLPLKELLESAFLTHAVPNGLDTLLGTAGRNYQMLPEDNPVLQGFNEFLALSDIEAVMRIQQLYR
jgi:cobalamin-dependent methionine synthase I